MEADPNIRDKIKSNSSAITIPGSLKFEFAAIILISKELILVLLRVPKVFYLLKNAQL